MRVLASTLAVAAIACATAGEEGFREELRDTPAAAAHAVLGERLATRMRGLARLSEDRLPKAMDLRTAEGHRREEVVAVALEMAESADSIRSAAMEADLGAAERVEFVRLATQLGDEARALAESARAEPPVELPAHVDAVRQTCNECHQTFRIPGIPDEQ
jgi:cytochrome c556